MEEPVGWLKILRLRTDLARLLVKCATIVLQPCNFCLAAFSEKTLFVYCKTVSWQQYCQTSGNNIVGHLAIVWTLFGAIVGSLPCVVSSFFFYCQLCELNAYDTSIIVRDFFCWQHCTELFLKKIFNTKNKHNNK